MKHRNTMQTINEMSAMLRKNKISLNEAFNLPDYGYGMEDDDAMNEEQPQQRETPNQPQQGKPENMEGNGDIEEILKQIRIMSLNGITQLAETPEDSNYEVLKKVWVIVDKATIDKVKEGQNV